MTPEGRVKEQIKNRLKAAGAYWHCPVQNGFGKQGLDFMNVVCRGHSCTIEAKAPGEVPTVLQERTIKEIRTAGGYVMVIDGNYEELEKWLAR